MCSQELHILSRFLRLILLLFWLWVISLLCMLTKIVWITVIFLQSGCQRLCLKHTTIVTVRLLWTSLSWKFLFLKQERAFLSALLLVCRLILDLLEVDLDLDFVALGWAIRCLSFMGTFQDLEALHDLAFGQIWAKKISKSWLIPRVEQRVRGLSGSINYSSCNGLIWELLGEHKILFDCLQCKEVYVSSNLLYKLLFFHLFALLLVIWEDHSLVPVILHKM